MWEEDVMSQIQAKNTATVPLLNQFCNEFLLMLSFPDALKGVQESDSIILHNIPKSWNDLATAGLVRLTIQGDSTRVYYPYEYIYRWLQKTSRIYHFDSVEAMQSELLVQDPDKRKELCFQRAGNSLPSLTIISCIRARSPTNIKILALFM